MFTYGFVPWRLRKLCTGDPVPEVIPMGLFTWSTESLSERKRNAASDGWHVNATNTTTQRPSEPSRINRVTVTAKPTKKTPVDSKNEPNNNNKRPRVGEPPNEFNPEKKSKTDQGAIFIRQQRALQRQGNPIDDEDTKSIRYRIHFTEGFGIKEVIIPIFLVELTCFTKCDKMIVSGSHTTSCCSKVCRMWTGHIQTFSNRWKH